jgi:hypothetical protein
MPAAAEETREEVEGVMMVTSTAALLALFETFMAVLIVDFARLGIREGFVCFCYFDEFLFSGFVASAVLR